MNAEIGVFARESRRYVVDVAAALIVVDDGAQRHVLRHEGQVQDRSDIGIIIPMGGCP